MRPTLALLACLLLSACGRPQYLGGTHYETYGLLNESTWRAKNVCYEASAGNIILSIVFIETIIFPVYFVGFSLFNPVRLKRDANDDCSVYG